MILLLPLVLAAADAGVTRPPPWNLKGERFIVERPFDPVVDFMGVAPRAFTFGAAHVTVTEAETAIDYSVSAAPDAGPHAVLVRELEATAWGHHLGADSVDDAPARVATWEWLDDERVRTDLAGVSEVITRRDEQVDRDAFGAQLVSALLPAGDYATADGGVVLTVAADGAASSTAREPYRVFACYLSCSARERWNVCVASRGVRWVLVEDAGHVVGRVAADSELDCGALRVVQGEPLRGPPGARGFKSKPPLVRWPVLVTPNELVATADETGGQRLRTLIALGQKRVHTNCGTGKVVGVDAKGVTVRDNETGEDARFVLRSGALVRAGGDDCGGLRAAVGTGRWQER